MCEECLASLDKRKIKAPTDGEVSEFYRVSQKKLGLVFRGHFRPLNDRKSKKARKQTPPKMQFYLLGGVFKSVCRL